MIKTIARPGHADFTANEKYHGFSAYRGGGHFSGSITAAIVAAGAILICALREKGIYIGTHIKSIADVSDRDFENYSDDIKYLSDKTFPVLSEKAAEDLHKRILDAKSELDSVGGILETVITGLPAGLGEPWFESAEGK